MPPDDDEDVEGLVELVRAAVAVGRRGGNAADDANDDDGCRPVAVMRESYLEPPFLSF